MSDTTRDYLLKFWALIDEILNAVLFLLIGLEVVAISPDPRLLVAGVAAIPLVLAARALSVGAPLAAMRPMVSIGGWLCRPWSGAACAAAFRSRSRCRCPRDPAARSCSPRPISSSCSR